MWHYGRGKHGFFCEIPTAALEQARFVTRLMQRIRQWVDLGMPTGASFSLQVYPVGVARTARDNQWIVKRRESQFLWSLAT